MSKVLDELVASNKKIETCLVGDKLTGQVGLVDDMKYVRTDVCEVKERLKVLEENDKKTIKIKKPSWLNAVTLFFGFYRA